MGRVYLACAVAVLLTMQPTTAAAQGGSSAFRVVRFDDGMSSWVYAFVRSGAGPVVEISDDGVSFGRDPLLVLACYGGAVTVVYRFDTELMTDADGELFVQYRVGDGPASDRQRWPAMPDPGYAAAFDLGMAALGADSANPLIQMFSGMVTAVYMSPEQVAAVLGEAAGSPTLTLRVTDPVDGETHTDVFDLEGLEEALAAVRAECR